MKKIMVICLILTILLTGCGTQPALKETQPETAVSTETQKEETAETATELAETTQEETASSDWAIVEEHLELYRPVLEQYAQALTEGWDTEQYAEAGLCSQVFDYVGYDGLQQLGYSLLDLDSDGVLELLIGMHEDGHVMDAYRLHNAKPERLFASMKNLAEYETGNPDFLWEDWYLCQKETGEFFMYYEVQKDWLISGYFSMVLEQGQLRITESLLYNSLVDSDNPWYRVEGFELDYSKGEQISHDEANQILYGYVDREGMSTGMISQENLEYSWRFEDFS